MPISKYFKGHGQQVMNDMQQRYGDKEGKSAFYATAEKRGMKPADEKKPKRKSLADRMAGL